MKAAQIGLNAATLGKPPTAEFVEVSLLLSSNRMQSLLALARTRGQTVGQILRGLIDNELSRPSMPAR